MDERSGAGGSDVAGEQNALHARISAALPGLSPKHREIARFLLDNPDAAAFASASEVGEKTGTSAATVVRFCRALGFEGYIELQQAIRERQSLQRLALQRLEQRLARPGEDEDLLTRVLASDIHNIERTALLLSSEQVYKAAADIRSARQVLIVASGLAAMLVEHLVYSLQRVDIPARSVTGGEEPLAMALAFLQPVDVVMAISFRSSPRYTVKALEQANSVGARSVAIAGSELSPLLALADHAFHVAINHAAQHPSPVGAVSLVNALVAMLSHGAPEQTADSLRKIDDTYRQAGLLDE